MKGSTTTSAAAAAATTTVYYYYYYYYYYRFTALCPGLPSSADTRRINHFGFY